MKILVVGDIHWSQYSSILRKRGEKYSYRLENLIQSVNWAEELAFTADCDCIVYLGDFFDRPEINSEELSALKEIDWIDLRHYFLVGNHEAGRGNLIYNSANIFGLANFKVIDTPKKLRIYHNNVSVEFIPYILEENRESISNYLYDISNDTKRIIFSHNDIKGIQMGQFMSKDGFSIEEIQNNCDLFLNGHLHNGAKVADKIINVGNLTGQNFSEDAFTYDHSIILLDTDTLSCAVYQNPYALNFYKLDFTVNNDIDYINEISMKMKHNCVATIKCFEEDLDYLRKRFDPNCKDKAGLVPYNCNMIETRFIVQSRNIQQDNKKEEEVLSINHIEQFKEYMINLYGNSEILLQELQEISK